MALISYTKWITCLTDCSIFKNVCKKYKSVGTDCNGKLLKKEEKSSNVINLKGFLVFI